MDLRASIMEQLTGKSSGLPFSFSYHTSTARVPAGVRDKQVASRRLDGERILHLLTCMDPQTHIEIKCEAIEYSEFPAIEWVLHFRNIGETNSPVLTDIRPLDLQWTPRTDGDILLHHIRGSLAVRDDFSPVETRLDKLAHKKLGCIHRGSSDIGDFPPERSSLPFFNLEFDGGGIIFAIGWSGTWIADVKRGAGGLLAVQAGMEHTHLTLLAGEGIRTPRILMFFWTGERLDAHNDFRKLILAHYTPQQGGKPVELPMSISSWFLHDLGSGMTEENQIALIRQCADKLISPDCLWMDAGWSEAVDGVERWGETVGNWSPKKRTFPNGLKPVSDEAAKHGMGFSLWFEPERVKPHTQLYEEHGEWLLKADEEIARKRQILFSVIQPWTTKVEALLNLGDPRAREWITDHVSSMIVECGVTIYRQDFNVEPVDYWRAADPPDRQGMTEIRYTEGLYKFWDDLLGRHPGLIIDSDKASGRSISLNGCASVERRIDIETIKRSVALYRSDWVFDPEGAQSHTVGINYYYPCSATACNSTDPYAFRSCLGAGMCLFWDISAEEFNVEEAWARIDEFRTLRPLFYGDFYPLTGHSTARVSDAWCAYQLYRKDLKRGAVIAFRRENSPYSVARFTLHGLEQDGEYGFTDIDTGDEVVHTGGGLESDGLEIVMPRAPQATIRLYRSLGE